MNSFAAVDGLQDVGPGGEPVDRVGRRERHDRVDRGTALGGVDEGGGAAHARADEPHPADALGPQEPHGARHVLPDRGGVLRPPPSTRRRRPGSTRGSRTSAPGTPARRADPRSRTRRTGRPAACAPGRRRRWRYPARTTCRRAAPRRSIRTSRPRNPRAPARGSSRPARTRGGRGGQASSRRRSWDRTSGVPVGAQVMDPGSGYLPSFIRWWRVRFRSFLCFFFRIFLRRFLISDGKRSSLSVDSLGSEQVPEVDALGAVALLQTDGPQSKGLGRICHGRYQPQRAILRRRTRGTRSPCTRRCRRTGPPATDPAARARTAAAGSA